MFLPISDMPKAPIRPYVTWGLMAVNIAVFVLISYPAIQFKVDLSDPLLLEYLRTYDLFGKVSAREVYHNLSMYDLLVFKHGFRPATFSLQSLLTSLFLHGGFMHLAGNMLFLYIFGSNVEYRLGWWRYLLVYVGCGIVATLFFALFSMGSQVPLIGASGAIFGVLGCYFLWFPKNRVRCLVLLFPILVTTILLPARWILGFYLIIDNLLPFVLAGDQSGSIAHGAHIGGFLGGLSVAWLGNNRQRWFSHESEDTVSTSSLASLQRFCPTVKAGQLDEAAACYFGLKTREQRRQITSDDLLAVGDYLLQSGQSLRALTLFRRLIAERPGDPALDRALFGTGRAMLQNPRYLTSAYHYFLAAIDVSDDELLIAKARHYLREIETGRFQFDREEM